MKAHHAAATSIRGGGEQLNTAPAVRAPLVVPMHYVPFARDDVMYKLLSEIRGRALDVLADYNNADTQQQTSNVYVRASEAFAHLEWSVATALKLTEHRAALVRRFSACTDQWVQVANDELCEALNTCKVDTSTVAPLKSTGLEQLLSLQSECLRVINAFNYVETSNGTLSRVVEDLTQAASTYLNVARVLRQCGAAFARSAAAMKSADSSSVTTTKTDETVHQLWNTNGNVEQSGIDLPHATNAVTDTTRSLYYDWQYRTAVQNFFNWADVWNIEDKRWVSETRARMTREVWDDLIANTPMGHRLLALTRYALAIRTLQPNVVMSSAHRAGAISERSVRAQNTLELVLFDALLEHADNSLLQSDTHGQLNLLLEGALATRLSGTHYIPTVLALRTMFSLNDQMSEACTNVCTAVRECKLETVALVIGACYNAARSSAASSRPIDNTSICCYAMVLTNALLAMAVMIDDRATADLAKASAVQTQLRTFANILRIIGAFKFDDGLINHAHTFGTLLLVFYRYVCIDEVCAADAMRSMYNGAAASQQQRSSSSGTLGRTPTLRLNAELLREDFSHLTCSRSLMGGSSWQLTATSNAKMLQIIDTVL